MPGIDLSTLTAPELRQLLRLARARRDGLLIDRVEWEMAQRASLSSRVGLDVERKAPLVIEDGDVTIDEVRAFRRPEPGLPPKRGGGRLAAGLGGMVAGSVLTTGAFAWAQGTEDWRLPVAIPALPVIASAERAPPKPLAQPPKPKHIASDAVAGVLAPEPFPPPAPVEVAEAPPPVVEPAPVVEPVAAVEPAPPKPKPVEVKPVKAKMEKASGPKVQKAKAEAAKPAKATKTAKAKAPATKAKAALAAKSDAKANATKTAAAKTKTKVAAKAKPTKVAEAKAKPAAKVAVAKKPAAKPAAKPKAQVVARQDAIDALLAKADASATARD